MILVPSDRGINFYQDFLCVSINYLRFSEKCNGLLDIRGDNSKEIVDLWRFSSNPRKNYDKG